MAIRSVRITDECTACGLCEDICSDVFTVEDLATVNAGVDLNEFEEDIKQAAEDCPVEAIVVEEG